MEAAYFPIGVLGLVVVAMVLRAKGVPELIKPEGMSIARRGLPVLTWFCDSEVNARNWLDFGARNSTDVSRGYLQVSLEALRATQGRDFTIQPVVGREAIIAAIPGADKQAKQLPAALFRLWAVANLCASRGGLVMDGGSTLCVGPAFADSLRDVDAATFGVDPDEPVANPTAALSPAPAPYAGYARSAGHPGWVHTAAVLNAVVAAGPTSWSAAMARRISSELYPQQLARGLPCIREVDGGRLPNGKARQLEDLLGRVSTPPDPNTALTPGTVYVPFDSDALIRRYEFAWFPRLNSQQLKESDLVWASYAGL
jgi:hypothetical protein